MELLRLAVLAVVCLPAVLLLRRKTPENALLLTLALLLLVLTRCLILLTPLLARLEALFTEAGVEAVHLSILLKTLGVALVTRFSAELCRDGGSQALATAVETAGAVSTALIALPLLEEVAALLTGFFR